MDLQFAQAHIDLPNEIERFEHDLDHFWTALTGAVVLIMQLGFAFLEAGCVRYKNIQSIMIKVYANTAVAIVMMWISGYGLMMGDTNSNQWNGVTRYAGSDFRKHPGAYADFVFNSALAAAANSIVSGGAVERMSYVGYIVLSVLFSGFIYPVVIHWAFVGWLKDMGYHDFAGSGAIHFTAAIGALVVTVALKPRKNRFDPKYEDSFKPANPLYICLSCLTLYMAWMCFNSGSTLALSKGKVFTVGNSIINTMIAGASGAMTVFLIHYFGNKNTASRYSLVMICNGNLAGLVAVTGSNDNIEHWAAFTIGIMGGIGYVICCKILHFLKVDDPVDAVPIHGGCGLIGAMCPGWFDRSNGIYYGKGAYSWGVQVLGVVCFFFWSLAWHCLAVFLLNKFGLLRVPDQIEEEGLDNKLSGGEAFHYEPKREVELFIKEDEQKNKQVSQI